MSIQRGQLIKAEDMVIGAKDSAILPIEIIYPTNTNDDHFLGDSLYQLYGRLVTNNESAIINVSSSVKVTTLAGVNLYFGSIENLNNFKINKNLATYSNYNYLKIFNTNGIAAEISKSLVETKKLTSSDIKTNTHGSAWSGLSGSGGSTPTSFPALEIKPADHLIELSNGVYCFIYDSGTALYFFPLLSNVGVAVINGIETY